MKISFERMLWCTCLHYCADHFTVRKGWSLRGTQHDCHQISCCQCASATSLIHHVPVGMLVVPMLPQMTVPTKAPHNARGSGFPCDVDNQLLLADLTLLVVCHQKTLTYLKHLVASNFWTVDAKQRFECISSPTDKINTYPLLWF